MKYIYIYILVLSTLLVGCSTNNANEQQGLDFEILPIEQIYEVFDQMNVSEKSTINSLTEHKLEQIFEPLVLNGKNIFNSIKHSDEVKEFISTSEFDSNQLEDAFYAQLSFTYAIAANELNNEEYTIVSKNQFSSTSGALSCLSVALGYETFKNLGLSGIMSARGSVAILKAFGKRYFFGYVGTAYMIYEFANCMSI